MELPQNIQEFVEPMFGQVCCRQRVWKPRSLWFGFGEKLYHNDKNLIDSHYGEWEMGTYYGGWKIIKDNRLLCGSDDLTKSVYDLDKAVEQIDFGRIIALRQPTKFDVQAEFDTGIKVDFLSTSIEDDECFGILNGNAHIAVEFAMANGWSMGRSDRPWQPVK
jgi:hypothetical protein